MNTDYENYLMLYRCTERFDDELLSSTDQTEKYTHQLELAIYARDPKKFEIETVLAPF